jgi:hypothetical protein
MAVADDDVVAVRPVPLPSAAKWPKMPADVVLHGPTVWFEDEVSEAVDVDPKEVLDLETADAACAAFKRVAAIVAWGNDAAACAEVVGEMARSDDRMASLRSCCKRWSKSWLLDPPPDSCKDVPPRAMDKRWAKSC